MDRIQTWLDETGSQGRNCARPLVTLSYAQSLDGSIALLPGQPLALSGAESLVITHRLRAAHQAILVGIGTILADDPRLNVRLARGLSPQPVVLDSRLHFPKKARLLTNSQPPWIATTRHASPKRRAAIEAAGARLLEIPEDEHNRVRLPALLERLAGLGINSLMVEGGAQVITSFLAERLVDRIVLTIAPRFLGGLHAPDAKLHPLNNHPLTTNSPTAETRVIFPRLKTWQAERVGEDLLIWGIPDWETLSAGSPSQILKESN
jgi:GTP cyclohydrolase II